jgi:hypothetical protein
VSDSIDSVDSVSITPVYSDESEHLYDRVRIQISLCLPADEVESTPDFFLGFGIATLVTSAFWLIGLMIF